MINPYTKEQIINMLEQMVKDLDQIDKASLKIDSIRYDMNLILDLLKDNRND